MISLNIGNNFEIKPDALPKSWVFYTLEAEGDHLYAGYTARLGAKLNGFQQRMKDDPLIREMCQRAHILRYQPYPQAIQALAAFKVFVHQHSPEYQSRIHPFAGYVYLAWMQPVFLLSQFRKTPMMMAISGTLSQQIHVG
jgi:predicted GIY-YIG superfamily endonuclease